MLFFQEIWKVESFNIQVELRVKPFHNKMLALNSNQFLTSGNVCIGKAINFSLKIGE